MITTIISTPSGIFAAIAVDAVDSGSISAAPRT